MLKMFESALDTSNMLLEISSDVMLVQGFVYACQLHGLPSSASPAKSSKAE